MDITVCVPTVPERADMLAECLQSIYAQTLPPVAVLVRSDVAREGIQANGQALLNAVTSEWCVFCSDDDLLDPDHLQVLAENRGDADVVYSYCRSTGNRVYDTYNQPFDPRLLYRRSIVAQTALFRASRAKLAGGFTPGFGEDWRLWKSMHEAGAKFKSVPVVTWTYRFHGGNMSWSSKDDGECPFVGLYGKCYLPNGHNGGHMIRQVLPA